MLCVELFTLPLLDRSCSCHELMSRPIPVFLQTWLDVVCLCLLHVPWISSAGSYTQQCLYRGKIYFVEARKIIVSVQILNTIKQSLFKADDSIPTSMVFLPKVVL